MWSPRSTRGEGMMRPIPGVWPDHIPCILPTHSLDHIRWRGQRHNVPPKRWYPPTWYRNAEARRLIRVHVAVDSWKLARFSYPHVISFPHSMGYVCDDAELILSWLTSINSAALELVLQIYGIDVASMCSWRRLQLAAVCFFAYLRWNPSFTLFFLLRTPKSFHLTEKAIADYCSSFLIWLCDKTASSNPWSCPCVMVSCKILLHVSAFLLCCSTLLSL
jgi:hypothetical protein